MSDKVWDVSGGTMTTSLIQEPQKKQKLNEEEDIDGNSKNIGNLPEELLRHILSFLPIEDAVRTSLLCKRWEHLWTSTPNLDFELYEPAKRTLFMNFVERVLCLRDFSDIKLFCLCCDVLRDASRINTWICTAVKHNVQVLYIELDNFEGVFSLPSCLFTCKTVTRLHLNLTHILKLSPTICFSNLKVLTIENVTFSNEYLTQQFFSSLPVLEELQLHECKWVGLKVVSISAPKLHSLTIDESKMFRLSHGDACQVMVFGDSLQQIYYSGFLLRDYCLSKSFSLEEAEIHIFRHKTSKKIAYRMHKLLIGISNAKFLTLICDIVEYLKCSAELLLHMPIFNNLISLTWDWNQADLDSVAILKILQKSPCLKILTFISGITLSSDHEKDDWILEPMPPCFLSHLKRIEVGSYDGDEEELYALKILLKNAAVLDEIIITCSEHFAGNLEKLENFYKQLIEFPRGPRNCKIVLE
ncbi:F-box/FBD/LRR-repeat protein At5g56420-like [Corylus avellana]|uniref:F-box/FBD/LRR-repeat protein At5g56420-like n=1 Tax=Corylus avellana TaxID=13451 RepID=UPI00286ADE2B|nr:F-box/FBD/LRR-repeat protein At5g56420-like [Corylus avellana]